MMTAVAFSFLLGLVVSPAATAATPSVLMDVVPSWQPLYTATVFVSNVPSGNAVTLYIPMQLREASVRVTPELTEFKHDRFVFDAIDGELASLAVWAPTGGDLSTVKFHINGTEVFGPVRFPVTVCANPLPSGSRCWTNEAQWASPTAYEFLLSCRLVAIGSLVFWTIAACSVCFCIFRMRSYTGYRAIVTPGLVGDTSETGNTGDSDDGDVASVASDVSATSAAERGLLHKQSKPQARAKAARARK